MTSQETLNSLALSQSLVTALVEDIDDTACRTLFAPDLSPLGWHLGHCVYTECYWLHEVIRGDATVTGPLREFYMPPHTPKAERGQRLPERSELLQWAKDLQAYNLSYLANPDINHALLNDEYLQQFLIQHYSQHYENMLMVLAQKALQELAGDFSIRTPLQPAPLRQDRSSVMKGHYRIGGAAPEAYDNELPQQRAELGTYAISSFPVSNAEYLAFMHDNGYSNAALWPGGGWQWKQDQPEACSPAFWQQTSDGNWFGIGIRGAYELAPDEPVYGLCKHEAEAFANWAGTVLPHEYQWEAACKFGSLKDTGRVWEWCNNAFHPYKGYQPFPYNEYSMPWFDDTHFTLKGGSLYTRPAVKRPSFRNFYQADKRHIFAGLRLAW